MQLNVSAPSLNAILSLVVIAVAGSGKVTVTTPVVELYVAVDGDTVANTPVPSVQLRIALIA